MNPDQYEWVIRSLTLLACLAVSALIALLMSRWGSRQNRDQFAKKDALAAIREAMEGTL